LQIQSHTPLVPHIAAIHDIGIIATSLPPRAKKASDAPKKRVLLITADGEPGGGVTNVLQLCSALKKDGHWHITLCTQTCSPLAQQASALCNEVHEIDFFKSRFDPRVTWQLRTLIRRLSPDLIHTHGSRAALPTVYATGRNGPPMIHTVHGFHFYQKSWLSRHFAIKAEQRIARQAQTTIFVCKDDKRIADQEKITFNNQSSISIYHGICMEELPQKIPGKKPTVVMLGRLVHQKQPEMLIEIADLLRDDGILFQFIGGGPLQPRLQREVERRNLRSIVTFSGSLPRGKALRLAATADLAVLPSRWEGFPISLLELLGIGIPVIAACVNGVPEAIAHGFNGYLVDKTNPKTYAQLIHRLIFNNDLRVRLSNNARSSVALGFSETRMVTAHLDLYRKAIPADSHLNAKTTTPAQRVAGHHQTASIPV
jgi:glycosyltransferase involved in cell wall biosynthesis